VKMDDDFYLHNRERVEVLVNVNSRAGKAI
jgi:hypothetical protein